MGHRLRSVDVGKYWMASGVFSWSHPAGGFLLNLRLFWSDSLITSILSIVLFMNDSESHWRPSNGARFPSVQILRDLIEFRTFSKHSRGMSRQPCCESHDEFRASHDQEREGLSGEATPMQSSVGILSRSWLKTQAGCLNIGYSTEV
jgi:hypothetical protein